MSILTKLRGGGETAAMVSLLTHAILGLAVITWIVTSNRQVFSRPDGGALVWMSIPDSLTEKPMSLRSSVSPISPRN